MELLRLESRVYFFLDVSISNLAVRGSNIA